MKWISISQMTSTMVYPVRITADTAVVSVAEITDIGRMVVPGCRINFFQGCLAFRVVYISFQMFIMY